jgi:single-strand DNA-binding protein
MTDSKFANSNKVTIHGLVVTDPSFSDSLEMVRFRFASIVRNGTGEMDYYTNWFTITAQGALAKNVNDSVHKGARLVVTGELKVRDWDNGQRSGTAVEIDAESVAVDLSYKTIHAFEKKKPAKAKPHTCNCHACKERTN